MVAVGAGSEAQARRLMAEGSPFPCLVDRERRLYEALGLGRLGLGVFLRLDTYGHYLRALRRGARPGVRTGDWLQQSGVALVDAEGRVAWLHRASTLGDYPDVSKVVATVKNAMAQGSTTSFLA